VLLSALDVLLTVAIVGGLIAALVVVLNRRPVLGPTVSMYAALGLGILALTQIGGQLWTRLAFRLFDDLGYRQLSTLFTIYGLVSRIAFALGVGLLVAAILSHRSQSRPVDPYLGVRPTDS
jgi:hypothetical protein